MFSSAYQKLIWMAQQQRNQLLKTDVARTKIFICNVKFFPPTKVVISRQQRTRKVAQAEARDYSLLKTQSGDEGSTCRPG